MSSFEGSLWGDASWSEQGMSARSCQRDYCHYSDLSLLWRVKSLGCRYLKSLGCRCHLPCLELPATLSLESTIGKETEGTHREGEIQICMLFAQWVADIFKIPRKQPKRAREVGVAGEAGSRCLLNCSSCCQVFGTISPWFFSYWHRHSFHFSAKASRNSSLSSSQFYRKASRQFFFQKLQINPIP